MTDERVSVPDNLDIGLVQQARAGDGDAFAELFNQLHQPVLNYIYHMLGDRQRAEDVTQDAFIRAHDRLDKLGPPYDFKSWVYRIASNLAIDMLRRERRLVDLDEDEPMMPPNGPTTRRPAERNVQRQQERRAVWASLDQLPTNYRQALVLREINQLSYQEVSRALDVSYSNARQLVHRARLQFREVHGIRKVMREGMQRCRVFGDMLSAFHDNELSQAEMEMIKDHIRHCPDCQQTEKDLKAVGLALGALPPLIPSPGWADKVIQQIQSKPAPMPSKTPLGKGGSLTKFFTSSSLAVKAGALITVLAVLGVGLWSLAGGMGGGADPSPSPENTTVEPAGTSPGEELAPAETEPSVAAGGGDDAQSTQETPTFTEIWPPIAMAVEDLGCRLGPDPIWEPLALFATGEEAVILGRNQRTTWLLIDLSDVVPELECWVWSEGTETQGNVAAVPILSGPSTPTPEDVEPPLVDVNLGPSSRTQPTSQDQVTFIAEATDNVGVAVIEIYVRSSSDNQTQLVQTCYDTDSCTYIGGPYPPGYVEYYAIARDAAGNESQSSVKTFQVYAYVY
ncbi:MAG: sigma-70 family RNA polymerase sigma factor [Anaerolineales bacterium]